jgi:Tfp pilus assembly protein PilO
MKHSTQRLLSLVLSAVFLVAALAVFMSFVRPSYKAAETIKSEKLSKENVLENQKKTVEQVQKIIQQYKGNTTLQTVASQALPPTKNESDAVYQLGRLAIKHQLGLQSVAVQNPGTRATAPAARGPRVATSTAILKPVGVLHVQARLTGTYASFRSFLSDIETNLRIMDVASISIAPVGRSNQDFYTFDITVAMYYQTQ